MTTPQGANLYTVGFGSRPENVEIPVYSTTDPGSSMTNYPIGKRWINTSSNSTYTLTSLSSFGGTTTAVWTPEGGGSVALDQLDGDTGSATPSGGAITIAGGDGVVTSASGSTVTISLEGGGVAIDSFVPDAGTDPVVPTALGAVTMAGTANEITTTGGLNTLTFSLPATLIAPGSLQVTGLFTGDASATIDTAGTALNLATDADTAAVNIGTGAAARTITIGNTTGATGVIVDAGSGNINLNSESVVQSLSLAALNVTNEVTNSDNTDPTSHASYQVAVGGASGGDPYIDFLVSGAGHYAMGIDNSASDNFVLSASGSLGTSNVVSWSSAGAMTNAGSISTTNGGLTLGTAGSKISITTGANASIGQDTLAGGTVTVNTTAVTASSLIFISRASIGATGAAATGNLVVGTVTPGTSFVINSVQAADATALQASDVSVINWWIIN